MDQEKKQIIIEVASEMKKRFAEEGSGHDWYHIERVWKTATHIAKEEEIDTFVVELGALLHDIADHKFYGGDEKIGGIKARELLENFELKTTVIDTIVDIVDNISFKGGTNLDGIQTIEGKIVQDADRLDAMGAIGIARCFAYGGHKGRPLYSPDQDELVLGVKHSKEDSHSGIKHFYEKLLLLKDLMHTKTGRLLAKERHDFMDLYIRHFLNEWQGNY